MSSSMPEPGHPKQFNPIPDGYEYSYLPHTFGGPWSQPLSCTRCGAIVIGRNVGLHDEFHGRAEGSVTAKSLSNTDVVGGTPQPATGYIGPDKPPHNAL